MPRSRSRAVPIRPRAASCSRAMRRPAPQALNCLASAVYYEAGNQDADGERAVAQVVLNRVRHPAFPASVCGVVYQGSTRPTGCQFTFTCDGSLNRQPDADGWRRAIEVAAGALPARSMRRSAGRPIITPIMSSLTGPRPWPRTPSSARTLLSLGRAAGGSRRCSPRPMPAMSRTRPRCAPRPSPLSARHSKLRPGPGRRGDQARSPAPSRSKLQPVDARRQARRGPVQPRRAQGLGRGGARGLCARSSRRRTISNGRCRATRSAGNQQPLGKPRPTSRRRRLRARPASSRSPAGGWLERGRERQLDLQAGSGRACRRSRHNRPTGGSLRSKAARSPQAR